MRLTVSHISKSYHGKGVLQDVSFSAGTGITCLTGPSGQGKTTLLRIILGLEQPDSGSVVLDGIGRFSAVFQENRLIETMNAMENLRFAIGNTLDPANASALLNHLGLDSKDQKPVRDFSGGMKRRLALARALLAPSELLVLDEPFTGLDAQNRDHALESIRAAAKSKCVLLVTHTGADAIADQIIPL